MSDPENTRGRSKQFLIPIVIASAFGVYLLIGYFVVPRLVESQVTRIVESQTGVAPTLAGVRFDPIGWRLGFVGFELSDPDGEGAILGFEELILDIRPFGFFGADIALDELVLVGPWMSADIDESGVLNLERLFSRSDESNLTSKETDSPDSVEQADALIVDIAQINVEGGDFFYRDRTQQPPFEVRVTPFELEIERFTTRADSSSPYALDVRLGESTELRWEGTIGVDPLRSGGKVDLTGLDLRLIWEYASESLRFEVREGVLEAAARYDIHIADGLALTIQEASVGIEDLEIIDRTDETEMILLPSISVSGIEVSVEETRLDTLSIAQVDLEAGRITTRRESDGALHLEALLTPIQKEDDQVEPIVAEGDASVLPKIRIDRIRLRDFQIDFEDRVPARPVSIRIAPMDLELDGYENTPGTSIALQFEAGFNGDGEIKLEGPIRLEPLELKLAVRVDRIGIGDLQAYLEEVARIDVSRGTLSTELELTLTEKPEATMEIAARGRLQIDDLLTIDRRRARKFLEWGSVRFEGVDLSTDHLWIEEIGVTGAAVNIDRDPEGGSNLDAIFGVSESSANAAIEGLAADPAPKAKSVPIRIDRITIEDFVAQYTDTAVEPDFRFGVSSLSGVIEGLSSEQQARANVDLEGRIDEVAPIKIEGQVNPLSADAFTDITIRVSGISMPAFAPYSGRFVGYTIDRGKLDLELDYQLSARSLTAKNHISLRSFAFGGRVESELATSLPVPLVVALMRNSAGDIEFDLPIQGDLDDPSFSVLGLVGKSLVNLISKAATAPFAIMGGLMGASGDDLAAVVFDPGSNRLSEEEGDELETLAIALSARPSLRLEIRGQADPEVDGPVLRVLQIEEDVRLAAFEVLSRRERERLGHLRSDARSSHSTRGTRAALCRSNRREAGGSHTDRREFARAANARFRRREGSQTLGGGALGVGFADRARRGGLAVAGEGASRFGAKGIGGLSQG